MDKEEQPTAAGYRPDGIPPGYYPRAPEEMVFDPMVPPARGSNFFPLVDRAVSSDGKISMVFNGWRLIPDVGTKPEHTKEINYDIPASSRPIPRPWKSDTKDPERANTVVKIRNKSFKINVSDGSDTEGDPFAKVEL